MIYIEQGIKPLRGYSIGDFGEGLFGDVQLKWRRKGESVWVNKVANSCNSSSCRCEQLNISQSISISINDEWVVEEWLATNLFDCDWRVLAHVQHLCGAQDAVPQWSRYLGVCGHVHIAMDDIQTKFPA
jgi:hypothetical protein